MVIRWASLLLCLGFCCCQTTQYRRHEPEVGFNSMISSVRYPDRWLRPYGWAYLRVELPPWFSSVTVTVLSDIDVEEKVKNVARDVLPILCFRRGGLPLPDVSIESLRHLASSFVYNVTVGGFPNHQSAAEQCFPFKKNFTLTLTNQQITSGVWYIGFFNGLGPERTQSKMIIRGQAHKFSTRIDITECTNKILWGPNCNQSIVTPLCDRTKDKLHQRRLLDTSVKWISVKLKHKLNAESLFDYQFLFGQEPLFRTSKNQFDDAARRHNLLESADDTITCLGSFNISCLQSGHAKVYSLDIVGPTSSFMIKASEVTVNKTLALNGTNTGVRLMCYACKDIFPSRTSCNHFSDITSSPMIIRSPEVGNWYIMILVETGTEGNGLFPQLDLASKVCFLLEWQLHECSKGKAGPSCKWESYKLERITNRGETLPFESYYLPTIEYSQDSSYFPLENLLTNSSIDNGSDVAWTYFLVDVPSGAGGSNMHILLKSDEPMNYEVFAKFGSFPSDDNWDYHANSTNVGNNSMLLAMDDGSEKKIDFYILYPKEGFWSFGIRHHINREHDLKSFLSISVEACPGGCFSHGDCESDADESGMTTYGYCSCDRDHGGFDCSAELVSPKGHLWRSIFLVASNGAAALPAIFALRRRAISEWVIFSCSGISSGLYHSCDVGSWCALKFSVLQFMDFWLSFMAVVSTFVYMTSMTESHKRAILTSFSVFTALLAVNGPTRSRNIVLVVVIGAVALILGWIIEILSRHSSRHLTFLSHFSTDIQHGLQDARRWPKFILIFIQRKFRWQYIFLGFIALSAAGISWKLENSKSYWIWHSIWHLSIYTSSFFFLCSTRVGNRNQVVQASEYDLTRQNSARESEQNETRC